MLHCLPIFSISIPASQVPECGDTLGGGGGGKVWGSGEGCVGRGRRDGGWGACAYVDTVPDHTAEPVLPQVQPGFVALQTTQKHRPPQHWPHMSQLGPQ